MREFLEANADLLLRLARAYVGPGRAANAEDVAQEVIVGLLRAAQRGTFSAEHIENSEAYLRVAVRHAAHRARTRERSREQLARGGDVLDDLEGAGGAHLADLELPDPEAATSRALDARHTLATIKARLRPRDAVAFALLVEDELGIDEVAAALGTTVNNVYQMRHRILAVAREVQVASENDKEPGRQRLVEGEEVTRGIH